MFSFCFLTQSTFLQKMRDQGDLHRASLPPMLEKSTYEIAESHCREWQLLYCAIDREKETSFLKSPDLSPDNGWLS